MLMEDKDCQIVNEPEGMREAVGRAESDLENGKCFSEADFEQRFAKWL